METEQYKLIHPLKHYLGYLEHNVRPDGRELQQYRPTGINLNSINTADGSAIVKLGNTTVICGIKAELAEPKAAEPENGFIVANMELLPLCSTKFRPGAPSEEAQVIAHTLDGILKNCPCFDRKKLCIAKDKLAWVLYCDVVCLNYDGSVLDAAVIALMTALKSLTIPAIAYNTDLGTYKVEHSNRYRIFDVDEIPVCSTFIQFADKGFIADPTAEEEELANGTISIAVHQSNVVFTHKPGGLVLSPEDYFKRCIALTIDRSVHIQSLIGSVLE